MAHVGLETEDGDVFVHCLRCFRTNENQKLAVIVRAAGPIDVFCEAHDPPLIVTSWEVQSPGNLKTS